MVKKQGSTQRSTASAVRLFDDKLLVAMFALEQIGEGLQKADPCQFTGHTMGACIEALRDQVYGRIEEIRRAGVNKDAERFLSSALVDLADYCALADLTFGGEDEVEHPCAVGAAIEALAQKAAMHINRAAWESGVKSIDFSIGDYGYDEHFKKAA